MWKITTLLRREIKSTYRANIDRAQGSWLGRWVNLVKHIRSGDAQGWFREWSQTGDRVAALTDATTDSLAR